jgi:tetratricopeptide (TPR) repeat protein
MRILLSGLLISASLSWAQQSSDSCNGAETPTEYVKRVTESSPGMPDASVRHPGAECRSRLSIARPETGPEVVRANQLAAPRTARKAFERAQRELRRKEPDYALAGQHLEDAVQAYPGFAEAWDWLGQLRYHVGEHSRAIDAFEIAIRSDPRNLSPYLRLAAIALQQKRLQDAIRFADTALNLNPATAEGHYYRAAACHMLDQMDCALQSAAAIIAQQADRHYPRVHLITGDALAARGDFQSAAKEYGRVVELEPGSRAAAAAAAWIANLEP